MSIKLSPRRSNLKSPFLVSTTTCLERLLRSLSTSTIKTTTAVLDINDAHATTGIDQPGPSTTLQPTVSEIGFREKLAEAKAAVHFKCQSDIEEDLIGNEQGYDTDIRQLVQAGMTALGVPTRTEIRSMIVNEIVYLNAKLLFPVLCKQVDETLEIAFATCLLLKNESVCQELNKSVDKSVENTIWSTQAYPAIRRTTCRTLESGSFVRDISTCIVENSTVVKSFFTYTKRPVDKSLDDRHLTTKLTKTFAELSTV